MKNLILIAITLIAFSSCDKVTEPYEKVTGGVDTALCPEPTFPPNTNTKRNVLIEDFTGHYCNNCPAAAYIIDTMKQNRGNQIVAIAVHTVDEYAAPISSSFPKYQTDFRTPESDKIKLDFAAGDGLPNLMVNRSDTVNGNGNFTFSTFYVVDAVHSFLNSSSNPIANLQIITTFDPSNRTLCAYVETEALVNLSEDYSLVIALTEDSIIDWQLFNGNGNPTYGTVSKDIEKYKHSHVLRKNINGTYGKTIITGSATAGDKIITGTTLKNVNTSWDEHHLYVVAYLFKNSTKEIVQVVEKHVE